MNGLESIASGPMWAAFVGFVLLMLALDLFVFGGNKAHKVSVKEAGIWSLVWVSLAMLFTGGLWWYLKGTAGPEIADQKALEFLSGYLIEKALSVDNVFVFLLIFTAFRVLYLFGAFLLYTGIRMLVAVDQEPDVANNPVLRFARKHLRVADGDHGEKFFVAKSGILYVTPLFLVLILIEVTDLVFAVDSIPAIFAITTDPFIVFTSNMFAILGLRALYFLLVDVADRFHLLKYGLAMVLTFIGTKMLIMPWYHVPVQASLAVVAVLIAGSCIASLFIAQKEEGK
jgi:tellurite resistance protein TerC